MSKQQSYQTKHKKLIMDFAKQKHGDLFSANDIYTYCLDSGISISLPTIYRQLENMCSDDTLCKYRTADSKSAQYYYDDTFATHKPQPLLKCTECGKTLPLKCSEALELVQHLKSEHHFTICVNDLVFYGQCEECSNDKSIKDSQH